MLTSQSLGIYSYKAVPRFELLLRFFIFLLLLGLCVSEGWAQILIDVPIGSFINGGALISSDYSFEELQAMNLVWSDPKLAGAIALGRVESELRVGESALPGSYATGGLKTENFAYESQPDFTVMNRARSIPAANSATDLNLGVLYIPAKRVENVKENFDIRPPAVSSRLARVSGRQINGSTPILFQGDPSARNITEQEGFRFDSSSGEERKKVIEIIVVNGSEVIDFAGGTRDNPNILETSMLFIPTDDDTLFIKNWEEYSDYFLVSRRFTPSDEVLSRIQFEGYDRGAKVRYYDETHWEIVPASEATIYGAILSVFALGATAWRKHGRRRDL